MSAVKNAMTECPSCGGDGYHERAIPSNDPTQREPRFEMVTCLQCNGRGGILHVASDWRPAPLPAHIPEPDLAF